MALSNFQSFVAILVFLVPIAVKGNGVILSPFLDNLCDEVECGRGSCETGTTYPFNFRCNCDDGWRRTRLDSEQDLQFLPCTIPNCSVDYSCMAAPPPVQATPVPFNSSFFDPCYWVYCGEGTCTKNATRTHTHTCECNPGSSNLLNISAFPCYRDCALGSESCESLGIRVRRSATNSPSSSNRNQSSNSNQATSIALEKFNWMGILIATFATIFLK